MLLTAVPAGRWAAPRLRQGADGRTPRWKAGVAAAGLTLVLIGVAELVPAPVAEERPTPAIGDADRATGWVEVPDPPAAQVGTAESVSPSVTRRDVPYVIGAELGCPGPGVDAACSGSQTLDIYKAPGTGQHPVALWVHSGGWVAGDKNNLSDPVLRLYRRGFDVVSVNYRLSDGYRRARFPTAVLDTKAAVRWVKANAEQHGFDADAILAIGGSAGGYLVQMVATTAGEPGLEPTVGLSAEQRVESSRVAAAVSFSGMCDLCAMVGDGHGWSPGLVEAFLGCPADCSEPLLTTASATSYVTADDAPVYAVTGSQDTLALPRVSDLLGAAYVRAGIGHRFFDDAVDSGDPGCWGHNPWCGTNVAAFDEFVDAGRGSSAQPGR